MRKEQKNKIGKNILHIGSCLFVCLLLPALLACGRPKTVLYSGEQIEDASMDHAEDDAESPTVIDSDTETETVTGTENVDEKIAVHVCGAVKFPGVYYLEQGSIGQDALEAAGGFAEGAAEDYVNLAACITGGEKLYIPYEEEVAGQDNPGFWSDEAAGEMEDASGKVNLNTATREELMTLPGIGSSKADAIVQYRDETGLFHTIEDIMLVPGIKEGTYNNIKEYIVVN